MLLGLMMLVRVRSLAILRGSFHQLLRHLLWHCELLFLDRGLIKLLRLAHSLSTRLHVRRNRLLGWSRGVDQHVRHARRAAAQQLTRYIALQRARLD